MAKAKTTPEQKSDASDLTTALGLAFKEVTIGGEPVTVRKFKFKDIGAVLESVQSVTEQVKGGVTEETAITMMTTFPDVTGKWIACATGKSLEWVGDQDHEEICQLLVTVIEVNSRFFTGETLMPMYAAIGNAVAIQAAGTTTSG